MERLNSEAVKVWERVISNDFNAARLPAIKIAQIDYPSLARK